METALGAFALTPLWVRLLLLYLFAGLALSLYDNRRQAGDSILKAVTAVLVAAVSAPVTAVVLLVLFIMKRTSPLPMLLLCLTLGVAVAIAGPFNRALPSPCANGQCPTERATGLLLPPLVKQPAPVVENPTPPDAGTQKPPVAEKVARPAPPLPATPWGFDITWEGKRGNKIIIGAEAEVVAATVVEGERLPRIKAAASRARHAADRVVNRFRRY
jgi:hypothetical protein